MNKININILLLVIIVTLIISIGATYAYFQVTITGETASTTHQINIGTLPTVTFTAGTAISMSVNPGNMEQSSGSNSYTSIANQQSTTMTASITNGSLSSATSCTYTIKYSPSPAYTASSAAVSNGLHEFTITGSAIATSATSNITSVNETVLDGVSTDITLVNGATIKVSGANTTGTVVWTFTFKYYNLNIDQSSAANATPGGILSFVTSSISCTSTTS